MATPQSTPITSAALIQWDSGQLFDGFLLLATCLPTVSSVTYPSLSYGFTYPSLRLPQWTVIPIANGVLNANTSVFLNSQITPPNTKYAAWFYDWNKQLISGPSSLFTIITNPYVITVPTLTAPTAPASAPTPATIS